MWLSPVTIVEPVDEPVTLSEAKEYLRIDSSDDSFNGEIERYIAASRSEVEYLTSTRMITQTVTVLGSGFADLLALSIGPVQSVSSIKYVDTQGVEQTLAAENYELVGSGLQQSVQLTIGNSWPTVRYRPDTVRMTAVVGYGVAGADLPADVHFAILRLIRAKFDDVAIELGRSLVNHRIWM